MSITMDDLLDINQSQIQNNIKTKTCPICSNILSSVSLNSFISSESKRTGICEHCLSIILGYTTIKARNEYTSCTGENMKKKYRDIVVNGLLYAWSYQPNNDKQEGGGELKIWKNKKIIYKSEVDCDVIVTLSYIAEVITATEDFGDVSNKQRLPCYQYCIYDRDFSCSWECGPPQLEPPIAKKRHLFPVAQWLQGAAAEQGGVPGNRPILPFAPSAVAMTL